ncbi:MAG: PAS domain S-box protein [Deltaproteobacteria bacterium]|nr:PAS domain S-box protein [Deltaproteobacteria bacterium]
MLKSINKNFLSLSPFIVIGSVVILLPIFIYMAYNSISTAKVNAQQLLIEKGAALIRSFEAGTRTGVMGMRWGGPEIEWLLQETALQPDIDYLMIADLQGAIVAHSDRTKTRDRLAGELDLQALFDNEGLQWRYVNNAGSGKIFEVFRKFSPTRKGAHCPMGNGPKSDWFRSRICPGDRTSPHLLIFVGLKTEAIEAALKESIRNTIMTVMVLLLIGFTGIISLAVVQNYREARTSFSRIKAFSDRLVETMPIGLITTDHTGRITVMNDEASAILKIPSADVIGTQGTGVINGQLLASMDNHESSANLSAEEIIYPLKDGTTAALEVIAAPLESDDRSSEGRVILFRDLTELKGLRAEIERSRRLASIGRLAAGVAHEIRNPLSSIKGFATYFSERYREIPGDRKTAEIMVREVDRLNRVVSQLLDFARPMDLHRENESLRTIVDESIAMISLQAENRSIAIVSEGLDEIGLTAIDPDRIRQVFLNLFLNAVEAMEQGGELRIAGSRDSQRGEVVITISDTGNGIPSEDRDKIFDPYYTTKSTGTGLGLAIAHRIIEAHNGTIRVDSISGEGTTFTIRLPRHDAENAYELIGRNGANDAE